MLYLFEWFALFVVGYIIVTQMVIPISKGLPIFPALREVSDLEDQVTVARENVVKAELKTEAEVLNQQAQPKTDGEVK